MLRGRWTVEALHQVRDVSHEEDNCRIRSGSGPQAMAGLRNLAIAVVRTVIGAVSTAPTGSWWCTQVGCAHGVGA